MKYVIPVAVEYDQACRLLGSLPRTASATRSALADCVDALIRRAVAESAKAMELKPVDRPEADVSAPQSASAPEREGKEKKTSKKKAAKKVEVDCDHDAD